MNIKNLKVVLTLFGLCTVNTTTFGSNRDIFNSLFIARETVSFAQDIEKNAGKDKIFKGVSFIIKKDNILKRDGDNILVKNLDVSLYPDISYVNGWLNLDKLATKADVKAFAKKVTKWPFKLWKTYMLTVQMHVYEFTKNGDVYFYTLGDNPNADIYKNYGHVYLLDDIALIKNLDPEHEGYFHPFAIYDKVNNRLCPLGKDFNKCDEFLNSDKEYNEFYLERTEARGQVLTEPHQ